ncbi:MAG: trehalase family glycosidase, partial [Verrucomicrobiales bacterium]|nr:trehalase family glycosidase [Verrucomicrobiales bacterium]
MALATGVAACGLAAAELGGYLVLEPSRFSHYVRRFNAIEDENVTNYVPNAKAWEWLVANIPFFECPDPDVEEIYYYRWWSFRKHIKQTPTGFVITEFLTPVRHAGAFNTISCAAAFHITEGRWLRNGRYVDDYILFWLRGNAGKPQPHFHKYSSWFAAAVWDRCRVSGNTAFATNLLDDLVADFRVWEAERRLPNGLFWQYDVRDGMEESISGSRTNKNIRPTINSYMFANARAIAEIARVANRPEVAAEFEAKAAELRKLVQEKLWDPDAKFFKVLISQPGPLVPYVPSDAREAIGFIPWMFHLPEPGRGFEVAWAQLTDPGGFRAPFGITTAERRHPRFRSRGVGTCEWDGAVWPFATCQTLYALANVLRDYPQNIVSVRDYLDAFLTYVHCQHANGRPYIGEYLDEVTGDWINGAGGRSRYYNHSTFADLLITGVVGLRPRPDDVVEVWPLLTDDTWDWFCLDGVKYHGRLLTILWDRTGSRYGRGAGLQVLADGKQIVRSDRL